MSINIDQLTIVNYPHPALRQPAQPIQSVTDETRRLADRMLHLMHEHEGVGLAAPQLALPYRIFVANPTGQPGPDNDRVYINPALHDPSSATEPADEGCLSIPGVTGQITRHKHITIHALDRDGNPFSDSADGLLARIWQHEHDHLEGTLILDRMPPRDLRANRRAIQALETQHASAS